MCIRDRFTGFLEGAPLIQKLGPVQQGGNGMVESDISLDVANLTDQAGKLLTTSVRELVACRQPPVYALVFQELLK